jgi:phosphoribosylformylglycinamidine (FGAM) synthase PurS component
VDLEALSAGQKIMVRVGADNEARLKAKLKEMRAEIVANSKKP